MRKSTIRFMAVITALLFAAGCAVLTVDVDVYKGPLANQEHIQGEQVISLAMGVKPLLVQLRDQLEVCEPPFPVHSKAHGSSDQYANDLEQRLSEFRTNDWYQPGYIIPGKNTTAANSYPFKNEFGVRVNEILNLYDDRIESAISDSIAAIRTLTQKYQVDFEALQPSDPGSEIMWWNEIKPSVGSTQSDLANLISQYDHFFSRRPYKVTKEQTTFAHWLFLTNTIVSKPDNLNLSNTVPPVKNAEFANLLDSKAETDANHLFPDASSATAKAEFVQHVKDISQSFFDARGDLQQLLRTALQIISQASLEQTQGTIDLGTFRRVRNQASIIAAHLISGNRLAQKIDDSEKARLGAILKGLPEHITVDGILRNVYTNQTQWDVVVTAVRQLLNDDEDGTLSLKFLSYDHELSADGNVANKFGLAYSPVNDAEGLNLDPNWFQPTLQSLKAITGGSLHGGRSPTGIETLIENYLKQDTGMRNPAAWPTNIVFQDLLDGLTEFAEKVVTLGNTAKLLDGSDTPEVENYVTVLQAVGNSIIVQVDELKARAASSQSLQARAVLVGKAISESGGFTNAGLRPWPPTNSTAESNFDAKDAAEQLETSLRLEYLRILHEQALAALKSNSIESKQNTNILASATDLVLDLDISTNRMVTNAVVILPDFVGSPKKKTESSGTNVLLGLGNTNSWEFLPISDATKTPKPKAGPGTNLVIKLAVSTNGTITNAIIEVTPAASNVTPDISAKPAHYKVTLSISPEALITNADIKLVTSSANADALSTNDLAYIGLTIEVTGRLSNSPPLAATPATNSTDKFLVLLEKSTEFRAGMIYLRPASSYLRSSYPASTLLKDQGQVWHNMLSEQMLRGIPFVGGLGGGNRAAILSELDKQSWQNINRVRVAGAFKVNYVVAKDDIGNWYIKSFSNDPTNVFKSIAGLASYAAGGALPGVKAAATAGAAAASAGTNSALTSPKATPKTTPSSSVSSQAIDVLDAEFLIVASNYLAQTSNTLAKLSGTAGALEKTITNTWFASGNVLTSSNDTNALLSLHSNAFSSVYTKFNAVSNSLATATNSAPTNGPQAMAAASKCDQLATDLLKTVTSYESTLLTNISQQTWSDSTKIPPDLRAKAAATLNEFLNGYFTDRQKALDTCEAALNLINQASSTK